MSFLFHAFLSLEFVGKGNLWGGGQGKAPHHLYPVLDELTGFNTFSKVMDGEAVEPISLLRIDAERLFLAPLPWPLTPETCVVRSHASWGFFVIPL